MTEVTNFPQPVPAASEPGQAVGMPGGQEALRVEPQFVNYFAFSVVEKWFFPDGNQWIAFKIMSEGDKAAFQRLTSRDVKVNRNSGDASFPVDAAGERHTLIKTSVVDWYIFAPNPYSGEPEQVPFSLSDTRHPTGMNLEKWLKLANPKLVEELEYTIRKANPWMQADMTIEEIDKEIERLQDLRRETEVREAGK